jgi:hypothetical protein
MKQKLFTKVVQNGKQKIGLRVLSREGWFGGRMTRLGYFLPIGLLWAANFDFEKMKYPKEMVTFWATFCLSNSLHFHLNKQL